MVHDLFFYLIKLKLLVRDMKDSDLYVLLHLISFQKYLFSLFFLIQLDLQDEVLNKQFFVLILPLISIQYI